MTIERAIEILDPEHRVPCDSLKTVQEACQMGVEALRVAENHGLTIEGMDYALRQHQIVIYDEVEKWSYCPKCEKAVKRDG